ncbi:MAG: hypothetical protein JJU40_11225 [Rhodobacteraceae bacterium]|nr:hypothetical protein [Paracoccaceae bacterium]
MSRKRRTAPVGGGTLAVAIAALSLAAPLAAGLAAHGGWAVAAVVAAYLLALLVTSPRGAGAGEVAARLGGGALLALALYGAGLGIGWGTGFQPALPQWAPGGALLVVAALGWLALRPVDAAMDAFLQDATRELETVARQVKTTEARPAPTQKVAAPTPEAALAAEHAPEEDVPPPAVPQKPPFCSAPEVTSAEIAALDALEAALDSLAPQPESEDRRASQAVARAAQEVRPELLATRLWERARSSGQARDLQALTAALAQPGTLDAMAGSRAFASAFEAIVAAGCATSLTDWIAAVEVMLPRRPDIAAELPEVARMTTISRQLEAEDEALADRLVALAALAEDILLGVEE